MSRIGYDLPVLPREQVARDRRLLADTRARARVVVAGEARDAAELARLLSMLDLNPDERDQVA